MTLALDTRADPKKPYGDVTYADPGYQKDGKARYPINSPDHAKAAWSYINQAGNAAQYSSEDLKKVKSRIMAACRKFGIHVGDNMNSRPDLGLCVRSFGFELEQRASSDGRLLEGYAAVYNSPARIRDLQGDFDEVILPGAFTRSLGQRVPVMQWEHGKDPRVGAVPIAEIQEINPEDRHGLYVRARLFDNPIVEPIRQAIAARAVRGMSFRFEVPKEPKGDTWTHRSGKVDLREIRDADTHELGPVVFPAYDTTSVTVRSLLAQLDPDEHRALIRELAAELRLAVDLEDLVGRSGARSADGDDIGDDEQGSAVEPALSSDDLRLQEQALRALGVLSG